MVNYKTRPGIVLVKICGVKLLIPTREASEKCNYFKQLTFLTGAIWQMLEKGKTTEEIYTLVQRLSKKTESEVHERVDTILKEFADKGFIIVQND